MTDKKERKYSLIAALCYTAFTLYTIVYRIWYTTHSEYASITFLNVFYWVILLGFCAVLYMQKNNIVAVVVAGANIVLNILYIIRYVSLFNVLDAVAAIVVLLILLFISIDSARGKANISKSVFFLPAAIMFINYLIEWIRWGYFADLGSTWHYLLSSTVECIAVLFLGFWVREIAAHTQQKTGVAVESEYSTFNPNGYSRQQTPASIGGADKLKMYKDLLDAGTITQEEFDAKKRQILGN